MGTFRRDDLGKREMCGEKNVTNKRYRPAKTRLFATPVANKRSAGGLFATSWPVSLWMWRYAWGQCVSGEVARVVGESRFLS